MAHEAPTYITIGIKWICAGQLKISKQVLSVEVGSSQLRKCTKLHLSFGAHLFVGLATFCYPSTKLRRKQLCFLHWRDTCLLLEPWSGFEQPGHRWPLWLGESSNLAWIHSFTTHLMISFPSAHLVPLGKRQVVNRLVYKALQTISHGHSVPADSLPLQVIRFETELPMDVVHNDRPLTPGITSFDVCDPSPSQCRIGEEIVLNLMVPDRWG